MADIQIHYSTDGTFAAVYCDGALVQVGDTPAAEQQALELAGVVQISDEAFRLGGTSHTAAAPTLADIAAYRHQRDRRLADAAALRRLVAKLTAEAEALENGAP